MSYVDIAIIAIVALGALIGLWKGFFKTLIGFCGWLVSFVAAFFLTKIVADALLDVDTISQFVVGADGFSFYSWMYAKLPADMESGIVGKILAPLVKIATENTQIHDVTHCVALLLANAVFRSIVCAALTLVIRLVMLLFTMFANAMTKDKFTGALNRLLGLVFGAVKGAFSVFVIMIIMTYLLGASFMAPVSKQVDNSVIGKPVYEQVTKLTEKFIGGTDATLSKLINLSGRLGDDELEEDGKSDISGTYKYENDNFTYTLNFGENGSFYINVKEKGATDDGTNREGTYTYDSNKVTLTFEFGETVECKRDAGAIYFEGYWYCKEGVTAPAPIEVGGTYSLTDGSIVYTLVIDESDESVIYSYNAIVQTGTYTFSGINFIIKFDEDDESIVCPYDYEQKSIKIDKAMPALVLQP